MSVVAAQSFWSHYLSFSIGRGQNQRCKHRITKRKTIWFSDSSENHCCEHWRQFSTCQSWGEEGQPELTFLRQSIPTWPLFLSQPGLFLETALLFWAHIHPSPLWTKKETKSQRFRQDVHKCFLSPIILLCTNRCTLNSFIWNRLYSNTMWPPFFLQSLGEKNPCHSIYTTYRGLHSLCFSEVLCKDCLGWGKEKELIYS